MIYVGKERFTVPKNALHTAFFLINDPCRLPAAWALRERKAER